jgi:hypothetical protein
MGTIDIGHKSGSHKETISRDIRNFVTNGLPTQNSQIKKRLFESSLRLMPNNNFPFTKKNFATRLCMKKP